MSNDAVEKDMTEGLPSSDTPTHIARRALLARLDTTVEELGKPHRSDAGIHDMRKELKRARAALRMLRECIGVVEYRRDNALLRDAARPLTPIRDAKVSLQTLEQLIAKKGATPGGFLIRFRKILQGKRQLARRQLRPAELTAAARVLRGIRRRAAALPAGRLANPRAHGLEHAFKKARTAFALARRQGTDENLHEWRKQTKYFANQLEMVLPFGSKLFEKSHERASQLSDCLGDDHDLAILTEQIYEYAKGADAPTANEDVRELIGCVGRRRKKLQRRALCLGRRLHCGRAARYRP
ncbi:MAG: CHAD domain-containing protein [Steroidobacteraceae bacterium]